MLLINHHIFAFLILNDMSKKILIIEDNRDLARLLETHLRDLSFQVDLSFDGLAGVAKAQADVYDLIILDLMLPDRKSVV